jgi:hypothetical protein
LTLGLAWGGVLLAAVSTVTLLGLTAWALGRAWRRRGSPGLAMGVSIIVGAAGLALVLTRGLSGFCGYPTSICPYPPSTMSAAGQVLLVAGIAALLGSAVVASRRGRSRDIHE